MKVIVGFFLLFSAIVLSHSSWLVDEQIDDDYQMQNFAENLQVSVLPYYRFERLSLQSVNEHTICSVLHQNTWSRWLFPKKGTWDVTIVPHRDRASIMVKQMGDGYAHGVSTIRQCLEQSKN